MNALCVAPIYASLAIAIQWKENASIVNYSIIGRTIYVFNGSIRIPIAQVFANQRACSGSCQTLPLCSRAYTWGPHEYAG